jgi:hypothetical protein
MPTTSFLQYCRSRIQLAVLLVIAMPTAALANPELWLYQDYSPGYGVNPDETVTIYHFGSAETSGNEFVQVEMFEHSPSGTTQAYTLGSGWWSATASTQVNVSIDWTEEGVYVPTTIGYVANIHGCAAAADLEISLYRSLFQQSGTSGSMTRYVPSGPSCATKKCAASEVLCDYVGPFLSERGIHVKPLLPVLGGEVCIGKDFAGGAGTPGCSGPNGAAHPSRQCSL